MHWNPVEVVEETGLPLFVHHKNELYHIASVYITRVYTKMHSLHCHKCRVKFRFGHFGRLFVRQTLLYCPSTAIEIWWKKWSSYRLREVAFLGRIPRPLLCFHTESAE
jgi:hypothetical protein